MDAKPFWVALVLMFTAALAGCADTADESAETFPQEDGDTDLTEAIEQDVQEDDSAGDTDVSEAFEQDIQEEV